MSYARRKGHSKKGTVLRMNYFLENLELAIDDVKKRKMTLLEAAKKYGIPQSTLSDKLRERYSMDASPGRKTTLSAGFERKIVDCVLECLDYDFPLNCHDVQVLVRDLLNKENIKIPEFRKNNNMPGKEWLRYLKRRHPELTTRVANNIKIRRAKVSSNIIDK